MKIANKSEAEQDYKVNFYNLGRTLGHFFTKSIPNALKTVIDAIKRCAVSAFNKFKFCFKSKQNPQPERKIVEVEGINPSMDEKKNFQQLEVKTKEILIGHTYDIGRQHTQYFENRYADILPDDSTLIGTVKHSGIPSSQYPQDFYIHANRIHLRDNSYIQTQGILQHTIKDFWLMVITENSRLIVNVTNDFENNREKCFPYYLEDYLPSDINGWKINQKGQLNETTISHTATNAMQDQKIIKRIFMLTKEGEDSREITHLHYMNWPDHGGVSPAGLRQLISKIKESKRPQDGPPVIHCSAGVGRSATLIVIDAEIDHIQKQIDVGQKPKVNIDETILLGRKQRNQYFVQTAVQYKLIHQTLEGWTFQPVNAS